MNDLVQENIDNLPAITAGTNDLLDKITSALGVSRDVLPSKENIDHTWDNLPRCLVKFRPNYVMSE